MREIAFFILMESCSSNILQHPNVGKTQMESLRNFWNYYEKFDNQKLKMKAALLRTRLYSFLKNLPFVC
jgi:hypothetical protein